MSEVRRYRGTIVQDGTAYFISDVADGWVSGSDFDAVVSERDQARRERDDAKDAQDALAREVAELRAEIERLGSGGR